MTLLNRARAHSRSILAFAAVWAVYGVMINARDLDHYGLYQIGAEAIVDHGTLAIGETRIPQLQGAGDGDVFEYNGRAFIAKQPGSMVATAIPYLLLKPFGFTYERDSLFLGALAAWLTAGLLAALSVVLFYHFVAAMGHSHSVAAAAAGAYAFGTTLFPYTGVPHHDVIASCLLYFAALRLFRLTPQSEPDKVTVAGMLLGCVLFFSMLPALMVAAVLVFALFQLGWRRASDYGLGFATGAFPLCLFNYYYFDHPLRQANMAGGYDNTFFAPTLDRLHLRADEYFSVLSHMSATKNMPVFVLAMAGVFFLPSKYRAFQWLVVAMIALQLGYLFSIGTEGHCQFGPRYLLPLIPFVMTGFATWLESGPRRLVAIAALVASVAVNTLGAVGDSMQCANLVYFPATHIWETLIDVATDHRPLLPLLAGLLAFAAVTAGLVRVGPRIPAVRRRFFSRPT